MVEGGRIDHACHANDVTGAIYDTLAFDDAVKVAMEFYKAHPEETAIIVVGDHETGGMGLGFGKNYFLNLEALDDVKVSVEDILQYAYNGDRNTFFSYISKNCGLDDLRDEEKASILAAMDDVDGGVDVGKTYGGYNPVSIAVTHIIDERASMYFTTYAHSGTSIPMSAIGAGTDIVGGFKDNTQIAQAVSEMAALPLQ